MIENLKKISAQAVELKGSLGTLLDLAESNLKNIDDSDKKNTLSNALNELKSINFGTAKAEDLNKILEKVNGCR